MNYIKYWEHRYKNGGNSGDGSYGASAQLKGEYITNLISEYNIKLINDYGHGDCNQLNYIKGFESYVGYDISNSARLKCLNKNIKNTKFINNVNDFGYSDLSMSLDVLYHIIDYDDFKIYLNNLFDNTKYVLIYAMDLDEDNNNHVLARKFTNYISNTFSEFELVRIDDGMNYKVKFYLYKNKLI
jgi:hypothetical protein